MSTNFFAYLYRMKYIERWSLMRSGVKENVAEHSHNVAMFAHALGVINNVVFAGDADPERLAVAALYHESSEVLTGDLPTPVKYYNPAIRTAYKDIERISCEKLLSMLPEELRAAYRPVVEPELPVYEQKLLKAADKLSALVKCIEEVKCGNREFVRAKETIADAIVGYGLAEAEYFMREVLPSFELTLDELEG